MKKQTTQACFFGILALWLAVSTNQVKAESETLSRVESTLQSVDVVIQVVDSNGVPVIGATVISVENPSKGGITLLDGKVTLQGVPTLSSATITLLGYKSQTVEINSRTLITVTLEDDVIAVDEVVVVGYGVQKKENLTGAISQVRMDEALGDRPVTSVASALQGAVPGLSITGGTTPGESSTFSIRGIASINGTGSPLILIDNVPGDIDMLDPEDIETVSVLKDAASSAIYGARAAFGVILITTKKGVKNEKFKMNYNNSISFEKNNNIIEQASVKGIIQAMDDYRTDGKFYGQSQSLSDWLGYIDAYNDGSLLSNYTGGTLYAETGQYIASDGLSYYLKDNDPQGAIYDNYGFMHKHNLSATGGTDKITYRMALGYVDKNGIIVGENDTFGRVNASGFVKADLAEWISTSVDFRHSTKDRSYNNRGLYGTTVPRFFPSHHMVNIGGELVDYITDVPYSYAVNNDPITYKYNNTRVFSQTIIKPIKGLEAIFEYTYDGSSSDMKSYSNNFYMSSNEHDVRPANATPEYQNDKSNTTYNAINAYATYNWSSANQDHNIKGMAGFSQERSYYELLSVTRQDMISTDLPSVSGATGQTLASDAFTDFSIRGAFFRVNYDYQNKYLLEVNGRYDGSSRFPTESRFGFFPSASIGWQVAKESFMEGTKSWLDEFKLRASWGQIGNQDIDDYQYLASMPADLVEWLVGGQKTTGLSMPSLVSQNFTWEVAETTNIGIDLALLKSRLRVTAEIFQRNTYDMLAPGLELPSLVGTSAPLQNVADLSSKGWEIAVSWRDRAGDFNYSIGFNLYDSKTEITKYDNAAGLLTFSDDGNGTLSNYYEGQTLGEMWGYVNDGYYSILDFKDGWQDGDWELKDDVVSVQGYSVRPGDVKFKDLNGDGTIYQGINTLDDSGDRTVIGNIMPRYQFGVNMSLDYKGFGFSAFLNGTGKRDAWLGSMLFPMANGGSWGSIFAHSTDYWNPTEKGGYTPVNDNPEFPRIYDYAGNSGSNNRVQDRYLTNAAFIRLKNVTLSYTFTQNMVSKLGLTGAKVFFSGENLLTFDHLPKGFDPERISWGYPIMTSYSFGINLTL